MAQDDYLSRISTAPGGIGTLQLGPQAYLDPRDQRYVHDAYQYFLNQQGGQSALPGGTPAATVQDPTTMIPQTGGSGQAGITAASAAQNMGGGVNNVIPTTTAPFVETSPNVLAATNVPGTPIVPTRGGAQVIVDPRTGDTYAPGDYSDVAGTLADPREKIDYTEQQDPAFWEKARDKFIETGQDIGDTFKNLAGQGIDFTKMAGSAIMNFIQPGLGLAMQVLPKDTPIDKFNREYALGGDLYQNVVSQVDDPNFEGRIQGYADDLIAGTGEGKDPFGINTVSLMGDYPEYATETFNELTEKAKQRAVEGKELSQFDKDRLDYYGHVSGLTGKTNIPGTPLMVDDSPLKTFPEGTFEDLTILPEDKPIIEEDVIKPVKTIAGNTVFVNTKTGKVFSDETLAYESLDPMGTGAIPPGEIGGPGYVEPPTPDNILAGTDDAFKYLDVSDAELFGEPTTEYSTTRPPGIDAVAPSDFGDEVDIQQGFVEPTVTTPTYISPARPHGGEGPRNIDSSPNQAAAKAAEDAQRAAIQEAARAGMTVNQAKASVGMPANLGDTGGGDGGRGGGGKIVCTMMNNSYGFGSFRNKIWLRHSKDLAPEYQIGYHKIFLPLVRLSKTNKLLKKTLEHIAVHRTIDIRQEARGKVHLLGRVYRKILEPICYWAGKYAKR